MRITVKFLQDNHQIKAGEERALQPGLANSLIKKGICEKISLLATKKSKFLVDKIEVEVTATEILSPEPTKEMTPSEYKKMKQPELVELCLSKGLEVESDTTKSLMISMLLAK